MWASCRPEWSQSIGSESSSSGTSTRSVPPRCADCGASAAAHTDPPATAIAAGLLPVFSFSTSRGPIGIDAGDDALLAAGDPDRSAADGDGGRIAADVDDVHDGAFVAGSIRVQRAVVAVDDPDRALADRQRARPVADRDRRARRCPSAASTRVTVPASSLATHSAPAPAAIALGFAPTRIGRATRPRSRSIRWTAPVDARRHPHRARRGGQRARRVADLDTGARPCSRPGRPARPCASRCRPPTASRRRTRARPGAADGDRPRRAARGRGRSA